MPALPHVLGAVDERRLPQYVGQRDVAKMLGKSVRTLQRIRNDDPSFPIPVLNGKQQKAWRIADILAWDDARHAAGRQELISSAVASPDAVRDDELADVLQTLSARFAAINGQQLEPDEIVGFTYRLNDEQRDALSAQANTTAVTFCETFGRLDEVRALLVVGGLMPVLRPLVDSCLAAKFGVRPGESHEELRDLAVDILCQSMEGEFVGPPSTA